MKSNEYLIVHKSILPEYFEQVIQARELINGNSITINGVKFNSIDKIVTREDCLFNKYLVIKKGKKTYTLAVIK